MNREESTLNSGDTAPVAKLLVKSKTYVRGLDEILHGGLPSGRTTLIAGGPGAGKSVLGIEVAYRAAQHGEPSIYCSFEERTAAIRENAATLGWDLAASEESGNFFLMESLVDPHLYQSGDFDLSGLLAILRGKAQAMGAKLIVLDALDVLLRHFQNPARERNELYSLYNWLADMGMTTLLTAKYSAERQQAARYDFLDFMADCVIHLSTREEGQVTTRQARITKFRGSSFSSNSHPFITSPTGLRFSAISSVALVNRPPGEMVSTGHQIFDQILGGGYRRGSCMLISGTSGTGKTTLASTIVDAACTRGERVLFIAFEESPQTIRGCMGGCGIDLDSHYESGNLSFIAEMPETRGVESHLQIAEDAILNFKPEHVIVDSVSACSRMGSETNAFNYLIRLLSLCKEHGVTAILTNQTTGFLNEHEIAGHKISSIIDTVVFSRYEDNGGELNRVLLVMKSRGARHSNQYREYQITDEGIVILDVFRGKGAVLTGTARQEYEADEALRQLDLKSEIAQQERVIKQRELALALQQATLEVELDAARSRLKEMKRAIKLEERATKEREIARIADELEPSLNAELRQEN